MEKPQHFILILSSHDCAPGHHRQYSKMRQAGWMEGGSNASAGKVFCPHPASCTMGTGSIP